MTCAPHFVRPCQPVAAGTPGTGVEWLHELQLAGLRFQVIKDGHQVCLFDRSGNEWTKPLAGFARAFLNLPGHSAVLDGQLVLPAADADLDGVLPRQAAKWELVFFAFDLLYRNGHDLRQLPLIERKDRLARLVARADIRCLHIVQTFDDGGALLAKAEKHDFRGIVSKRRTSIYRSGGCRDWRTVKTQAWQIHENQGSIRGHARARYDV